MAAFPTKQTAFERALPCETDTNEVGAVLGRTLTSGDTVLLSGEMGAGKSHLARALIRTRLAQPDMAVPSPTYTLVNVYADPSDSVEIWHADLYRLGETDELAEIGLEDAVQHAIVLVEWPERWGAPPPRHLAVTMQATETHDHAITITPVGPGWEKVMTALEALPT